MCKNTMDKTLLVLKDFYISICKKDNFIFFNKLSLKYQNTFEIVNDFIAENNKHFPKLKEYFKRNALIYLHSFQNISVGWTITA